VKQGLPIRVLIAEDDPAVRAALEAVVRSEPTLELAGSVGDAAEAIRGAERERPDVALLDVRMPGGGARAARGIKRAAAETRVLAFSAHDDRPTVIDMLEAGAVGYLVEGSGVSTIVDSITSAAAGRGKLSEEVTGGVIDELVGQLASRRRDDARRRRREERIRRVINAVDALRVVYQPIRTLGDRRLLGAEALARFHAAPKRGPARWFAEAEEVGLRVQLELAALERALRVLAAIPAGAFLSVNASPRTLVSQAFRKLVTGAGCERIVAELTEHAPVEDYARLGRALAPLRRLGLRLAIDDAGAGFASLRHILRLEPDLIKLDQALIRGIGSDRSQQALAEGLISFAERIGATIVAEGVESNDEVEALTGLGVVCGQGYYLGRPGPLHI
jgi:EAL domain-containing protein (putative c-di-GMP-specific phosphodiesterase class I)/AmiR/NasT family two-component response regulator